MNRGEHLTLEGLRKIVTMKASMNLGLSTQLKKEFSDIIPVPRSLVERSKTFDPNWLAGFTSGEGCFYISISKSAHKVGFHVQLVFLITQHSRDEQLMRSLISYFGCGHYVPRNNKDFGEFMVRNFEDINLKIIPFFLPRRGGRNTQS
jgi:LAGLIDADG endonuclease